MASPSVSRPGGDDPARPLKLYAGVSAHLVTVDEQNVPAGCFLCRRAFTADEPGLPCCERCGARSTHFKCYIGAIARTPRERAFFSTDAPADVHLVFVCAGCRS